MQQEPKVHNGQAGLQTLRPPIKRTVSLPPDVDPVRVSRLHLDSLDELVGAVPMLLAKLGQKAADLWEKAYNAKKAIDVAESKAYEQAARSSPKGKPPTVSFIERAIELHPLVQKAHLEYAHIETERRKVEAMIAALQAQRSFIPGLQGKQNYILQTERH